MPMLSAIRSMTSRFSDEVFRGTLEGYRVFIKVKPGRNNTNIMPKK